MNTFEISPEKTGIFSNLFLDYINKEKHVAPWTNGFPELASFAKLINETSLDQANRIILQACQKNQYLNIPTTVAVKTSIDLLGNSNTFTVCTGHQLCLFTGPAYFFYKIISCIQFCRQLKKEFPENNFIPVYWMASEDHDIDEIRSTFFFSKKIEWNTNGKGKAGRLALTNLKDLLVELEKLTDNNNNGVEILEKFNMFLDESNHLAEFIARIVNYWFGNYGLIVLDPDVVELKKIFKSEIENELISQTAIKQVHLRKIGRAHV